MTKSELTRLLKTLAKEVTREARRNANVVTAVSVGQPRSRAAAVRRDVLDDERERGASDV